MYPVLTESEMSKWEADIDCLESTFAERAPAFDARDGFVDQNVADLKAAGVYGLAVPKDFGGGGAAYEETTTV